MLINLRDRCPCCLEVYQLITSYSESVFFDMQAQEVKIDPFTLIECIDMVYLAEYEIFEIPYSGFIFLKIVNVASILH